MRAVSAAASRIALRHVSRHKYSYRYRTRKGVYRRQAEVTLCDACKVYLGEYRAEKSWRD